MLALSISHQHDRRANPIGQPGHFTAVIHPGFHNGSPTAAMKTEQRMRHADVVVEIAFRSMDVLRTPMSCENRLHHLRGRCFAVAAAHRCERNAKAAAPSPRNQSVSPAAVFHHKLRNVQPGLRVFNHQAECA